MQVYADNAATTRMSDRAVQAMLPLLQENFGNPSSLHSVGQRAKEALENARDSIAADLGVSPKEIYFTSGGSEADNQAIRSAAAIGRRKGKTKIISSAFEHHAVLHTLAALEKEGFTVELLPVHENGIVRPAELEAALDENTCLVTIMAANNEIGTLQPVAEIGKICRAHGVLFHTDAVQAVGHTRLHITQSDIDLLSLSAHKFHGPKGAGVLYARRGVALTNVIEGGAQERGKRAGTENVPAIVGMAAALHEAMENLDRNAAYVTELRRTLEDQLSRIPESRINGDRALRLPGTLNMCFAGIEGESCCFCWIRQGSRRPPAPPAPAAAWIPAMCFWPSAYRWRWPTAPCGCLLAGRTRRRRWRILPRRCPGWWRICAPSARFGSKCKTRKRKEQEREDGFVFR